MPSARSDRKCAALLWASIFRVGNTPPRFRNKESCGTQTGPPFQRAICLRPPRSRRRKAVFRIHGTLHRRHHLGSDRSGRNHALHWTTGRFGQNRGEHRLTRYSRCATFEPSLQVWHRRCTRSRKPDKAGRSRHGGRGRRRNWHSPVMARQRGQQLTQRVAEVCPSGSVIKRKTPLSSR